jgi:hypothetical protein
MYLSAARLAAFTGFVIAATALAGCASSSGYRNSLQHAPWYHTTTSDLPAQAPAVSDRRSGG